MSDLPSAQIIPFEPKKIEKSDKAIAHIVCGLYDSGEVILQFNGNQNDLLTLISVLLDKMGATA